MDQWHFCPTDLNPSDLCSRGFDADDDASWTFFLSGGFLLKPESEWPQNPLDAQDEAVAAATVAAATVAAATVAATNATPMDFIGNLANHVSSWFRLIKHVV